MPQRLNNKEPSNKGFRNILTKQGPQAFADVRSVGDQDLIKGIFLLLLNMFGSAAYRLFAHVFKT